MWKRKRIYFILSLALAGLGVLLSPKPMALAAIPCPSGLCPGWVENYLELSPNKSFIDEIRKTPSTEEISLSNFIMPPEMAKRLRLEYDNYNRTFESKISYGQASTTDYYNYSNQSAQFTEYTLRTIVSYQISESSRVAQNNSSEVRTFVTTYETIGKIANGSQSLFVDPTGGFKLSSSTNFPQQKGRIFMESRVVNITFDVNFAQNAQPYSPWSDTLSLDPAETYKLAVFRQLFWKFDAALTYGFTTTRLSGVLGLNLAPNFRTEYVNTRASDYAASGLPERIEHQIRVRYGLTF